MLSTRRLTVALSLAGAVASPVFAQAPDGSAGVGLEEVVVTARRVEENLQSVPVAVTAMSAENLRDQSVLQLQDIVRAVPGFTSAPSPRGDSQPNYMIRAQRGNLNPTPLTDPAVSVYFAEFNQSRTQGTNQALYDLSSVQVLKGPQGTLFGRNSTGGAILIEPNRPSDRFEGYVQGSVGNYDFKDIEAVINVPVSDQLSVRLAGKISDRDGYFHNVRTGQDALDLNARSARLSVLFKPTDQISSNTIATYYDNIGVGFATKMVGVDSRAIPAAFGPFIPLLAGSFAVDAAYQRSLGKYNFSSPQIYAHKDKVRSIQNNTTVEISDQLTFKNIIGYREATGSYAEDYIGSDLDFFFLTARPRTRQFSEEVQLQGKYGNLDFVTGLYYFTEKGSESQPARQFAYLATLAPGLDFVFPIIGGYDLDFNSTSYAGFAHIDYELDSLLDGLSVSGGIRYTRDIRSVDYYNITYGGTNPTSFTCVLVQPSPVIPIVPGAPPSGRDRCLFDAGSLKKNKLTYDVSVNYQMNPHQLFYMAHRTGYRTGGFNEVPAVGRIGLSYNPETVKDVEIGSKSDFNVDDVLIRLNAAAYYQKYSNIQRIQALSVPASAGGGVSSVTTNAAAAHVWGGEIELTVKPSSMFEVNASYAYTRARYDKWLNNYLSNGVLLQVDTSDSLFGFVPAHQYSVTGKINFPVDQSMGEPSLSLTYYGQTGAYGVDDVNTANCGPDGRYTACLSRQYKMPGYGVVNLRADWRNVMGRGVDLAFFANNVTNKYYVNYAISYGVFGLKTITPSAPRMVGVQLRVPFGS